MGNKVSRDQGFKASRGNPLDALMPRCLSALALLLVVSNSSLATPMLGKINIEKHKYYDNVVIETGDEIEPKIMLLDNRLVLDFKGATVEKPSKQEVQNNPRIESVRMAQFSSDPLIARVVFDLKKGVKYDSSTLYGKGKVCLEISDDKKATFVKAATTDGEITPKIPAKVIVPDNSKEAELYRQLKQHVESRMISSEEALYRKLKTVTKKKLGKSKKTVAKTLSLEGKIIVVDPGHGGDDPGAMGPAGIWEKELNLKVAFFLADYLEAKGAKVYMTRKTDLHNSLKQIADFANNAKADVYVAVHFNSIDNSNICGTETYYYNDQSRSLAEDIHNRLLIGIKCPDRGVRKMAFYTIHHTNMPGVIVEPIYMTHFQEGIMIRSKTFQKEIARDISLGIEKFLNGK